MAAVSKQLKALKAEQFKKGQQLFGMRNQERELTSEINGSNAQNRNLSHKLHKLDEKVILAASAAFGVQSCCQGCVYRHVVWNLSVWRDLVKGSGKTKCGFTDVPV